MSISTYSELQTAIANWLHRSDLTSRIPEFITMAESRLNREMRLRTMEQEDELTLSSGNSTIGLPSGYLEPLKLWKVEDTEREDVPYISPNEMPYCTQAAEPDYYTIDGANLRFERPADQDYTIYFRYLSKFALSDASPTNWLLTNNPDVYLYAALMETAPFIRDDQRIQTWTFKYTQAKEEIQKQENRRRASARLRTELGGVRWDINRGDRRWL